MTANDLRQKYLDFFTHSQRGHRLIPPAPLVPVDDPTTLFTSSGMQPLVPYLLGQPHPLGKRLTNSQPSFRAEDIEEVGDNRHTTFFEMLGNWSLGNPSSPDGIGKAGYFKQEQLPWFFEFLTQVVGLNQDRLYVSVFNGNNSVPKDEESIKIWQELFKTNSPVQVGKNGFDQKIKIYSYDSQENWWSRSGSPDKMPAGEIGGPDSEVFFDFDPTNKLKIHQHSTFKNQPCHPNCDCGRFLEIGNSVFMEYQKKTNGSLAPLPQKNVDFGAGLERILAAKLDIPDIFQTDLFWPIVQKIEKSCDKKYQSNESAMRIIADHLKAAVFMISEGVEPGNKLQGYVLRRLLRRAAIKMRLLKGNFFPNLFEPISLAIIKLYQNKYFTHQSQTANKVNDLINQEISKFSQTLNRGLKQIEKCDPQQVDAKLAFDLFQTYGFPFEISQELLAQKNCQIKKEEFDQEFAKHQKLSRTASKSIFKGGLADHSKTITKLHTATHLLHASLRKVLGNHIQQVGSNITTERLRFDFTHPQPLTKKELKQVEDLVNEQIKNNLKINCKTMSLAEAQKQGALAFFGQKYPNKVKVYNVSNFSLEVCAGPHTAFTGKLGKFKIKKEESCGSGKRRIYGLLILKS